MILARLRGLSREQKRMWRTLLFLVRLIVLSIPLYLMLWLNVSLVPLQMLVMDHSSFLFTLMGLDVVREWPFMTVGGQPGFTFFVETHQP